MDYINTDFLGTAMMSPEQGLKHLKKLAGQGDGNALRLLGIALLKGSDLMGRPVKRDIRQGLKLLTEAVGRDDPAAMMVLGNYYRDGLHGLEKDPLKARQMFEKAAKTDCGEGKLCLALEMLNDPAGISDPKKIFALAESAASYDVPNARLFLADLYCRGYGVRKSIKKAVSLYEEMASKGYPQACHSLSRIYADKGSSYHSEKKALNMLEKACRGGVPEALLDMAGRCETGHGTDYDPGRALSLYRGCLKQRPNDGLVLYKIAELLLVKKFAFKELYPGEGECCLKKAAAAEYMPALLLQGKALLAGWRGFPKDEAEGRRLIQKAAKTSEPGFLLETGLLYLRSSLFGKNMGEAFRCFRSAAKQGSTAALYQLGCMYRNGEGVAKSESDALDYFKQAALSGYAPACFEYGKALLQSGDPQKEKEGLELMETAARAGMPPALNFMGALIVKKEGKTNGDLPPKANLYYNTATVLTGALRYSLNRQNLDPEAMMDPREAFLILKSAAQACDFGPGDKRIFIYCALGVCYEYGIGCKVSVSAALKLYEKGVSLKDPCAVLMLSELYRRGVGVKKDEQKAAELAKSVGFTLRT